ncbi:MAG: 30S ribosomal protein S9 [Candidatus Pacebacteria bacterium]|nr:30S ribosomal protein S9 [Candidatus Paceibacterota bacterium]
MPRTSTVKTTIKKEIRKPKAVLKKDKFFEGIGRRKTSQARVRLLQAEKTFTVNEKDLEKYFPTNELQKIIVSPLEAAGIMGTFGLSVKVKGGGIHSQAEAVRHGVSNAIITFDPELRQKLKKTGYLTRDPRMRERKKFGLKRARRAPQWAKR